MIWAGSGVLKAGASPELTRLAEIWGAGVITSQGGRGAISEDHPQAIGNLANNPSIRGFIESCDVLLAAGTHFRGPETLVWQLPLPYRIVQLDIDPQAVGRNYPVKAGCVGDARPGLQALMTALTDRVAPDPAFLDEVARSRKAARTNLGATFGPYERLCRELRENLDRDACLVGDVTISLTTWGAKLFPIYGPQQYFHAAEGGIVQGFQMALGVKLAQSDKQVVALVGDGGFQVNLGELGTAAQEKIGMVVLLMNDGGYGVLRNIQDRAFDGRHTAVDLTGPDFEKLCAAYGLPYQKITGIEQFAPTLRKALDSNSFCLIEVDMSKVGNYKIPFAGYAFNK